MITTSDGQTPVQEQEQDFGDFWPEAGWNWIIVSSNSRIIFESLFRISAVCQTTEGGYYPLGTISFDRRKTLFPVASKSQQSQSKRTKRQSTTLQLCTCCRSPAQSSHSRAGVRESTRSDATGGLSHHPPHELSGP